MGDILKSEGDLQGSKEFFQKALRVCQQLAEETGTMQASRDLSFSYQKLGRILQSEGDLSSAKAFYQKGLAIAEMLVEKTNTIESRRCLSTSYNNLGNILAFAGDLSGAKAFYQKGLVINQQLAEETGAAANWNDLAFSCYKMHNVCFLKRKEYLQKAIDIYEKLCEQHPQVIRYREDLETMRSKQQFSWRNLWKNILGKQD